MRSMRSMHGVRAIAIVAALAVPATLGAQQGAGTTGAQALQLLAGARAAGLGGAYTAAGDADAMFYNPAGLGPVGAAAALSFQRHVQEVSFGSVALARRVGPVVVGLGVAYLDAGSIDVLEPDPAYGGERGRATGETVTATESATRLAVAVPIGERLRVGAVAGWATMGLADAARSAPFVDAGAQLAVSRVTLGAAVRNLGGAMRGSNVADAELPREARVGMALELPTMAGLGAQVAADWVSDLVGKSGWLVTGVEAGLMPTAARQVGLVGRVGYNANGDDALQGALTVGAGLSLRGVAVDYAFQRLALFGDVHRVGVRIGR